MDHITQAYFHHFGIFNSNILGVNILPWHSYTSVGKCARLLTAKDIRHFSNFTLPWILRMCNLCYTNALSSYRHRSIVYQTSKSYFQIRYLLKTLEIKNIPQALYTLSFIPLVEQQNG